MLCMRKNARQYLIIHWASHATVVSKYLKAQATLYTTGIASGGIRDGSGREDGRERRGGRGEGNISS
jgi:hypothetical protein